MVRIDATIERPQEASIDPFESPVALRAADAAVLDEDDDVMDGFLASLDSREFELFLTRLAETLPADTTRLEPTA